MNKRFALALTLLLGASLSFAQANGGSDSKTVPDNKKTTGKATSAQSKVALNPQPLPPGERKAGGDPASKVSLNPQPLPPKQGTATSTSAESKVALNPQPLPPGAQSNKTAVKGKDNKKGPTPVTGSPKQ